MTELEIKKLLVRHFLEKYENFVVGSEFSFQFGERRADLALLNADYLSA
ncbi:protein cII, partial [Vibrio anguillarum]|nr:protein cII [Vibrio anguillarum]